MTSVTAPLPTAERVRTPWSEFWRKFKRQHVAVVAGVFVLLLVLVAILAPWIVPYDAENYFDYDAINARPSAAHWFGVDPLGRDIFSRVLMGARISLTAGFVSVAIGALFGTALGLLAGYKEGWWDRAIMRFAALQGEDVNQRLADVLERGHMRKQIELLENHAYRAPCPPGLPLPCRDHGTVFFGVP